jgi:DNA polymerase III delta prime subunit
MNTEFLWVEKYRPHTVAETILPEKVKQAFQTFVDKKDIPNMILSGGPGVGKTTIARAMIEEIGSDCLIINGSNEGRLIDTLRNEITNFASSMSFSGGRKYVILDEADYLNPQSVQPALRNFMEEFSNNCGFILTCNYKNKIIQPLHSRCSIVDFRLAKEDLPSIASQFLKRIHYILDQEGVPYDKQVIKEVMKRYFPDWRRLLNELQRYGATGSIDTGMLSVNVDSSVEKLIELIKDRNFTGARKWIGENPELTFDEFCSKLYSIASSKVTTDSIPTLVYILADYQHKAAFVVNQEVNLAACVAQIMGEVTFK